MKCYGFTIILTLMGKRYRIEVFSPPSNRDNIEIGPKGGISLPQI
jgi:hypothetical protein